MLLKVRLPSSIPPIPKMQMPLSMTDVDLTLSALPSSSTILASILALFVLLSFVRALTIGFREHLAFVRGRKAQLSSASPAASLAAPTTSTSSTSGAGTTEKSGTGAPINGKQDSEQRPASSSSWLWRLLVKWDTFPSVSFVPSSLFQSGTSGKLNEKQQIQAAWNQQAPRQAVVSTHTASRRPGGPAYERPLPTLYQSDMPVSMAKMIMSRHTFRRPTSRPPPARPASVQIQIQRRSPPPPPPPSMSTSTTPASIPPPPPPNRPSPAIVIPPPKSPLYRPLSPPSRSPSPPSPSSASGSRTPSPERRSRTPSPTSSPERRTPSPTMEELLEMHGERRRESEIV